MPGAKVIGEPYDSILRNLKGNIRSTTDYLATLRHIEGLAVPTRQMIVSRVQNQVRKRLGEQHQFNGRFCYIGHDPTSWEHFLATSLSKHKEGDYFTGEQVWQLISERPGAAQPFFAQYTTVFLYASLTPEKFSKLATWASQQCAVLAVNWDDQVNFTYNDWWIQSRFFIDCYLSQRTSSAAKYSGLGLNWLFFPEGGDWLDVAPPAAPQNGLVYVGNLLGNKGSLSKELIHLLGEELKLFGPGTQSGSVPPALVPDLYLNHTACLALSGAGWGFNMTHLKCRHFEIPCSGGLLITQYTKDLERVFIPGQEVLTFRAAEEAAQLYNWVKNNPDKASEIRANGHRRAKQHAWSERFKSILLELDSAPETDL